VISGEEVARFVREQRDLSTPAGTSARNQLEGIVTDVKVDGLMAQVELQAGAFRVVSLISAEAATELGLTPGVLAVASVKSTNVVIDLPR
jgi:molybdopterin-binding protein